MDKSRQSTQIHDAVRQLIQDESVSVSIKGSCMSPLIENDARLSIKPEKLYWPGDVVVLMSTSGQRLAHRIIGMYRRNGITKVMTQADASRRPDASIPVESILGRVTGGNCHPHVVSVPLLHRLKASARFVRFITAHILRTS